VHRCEDDGGADDCEDFDSGPRFVDVPLGGTTVTVASGPAPAGTYREVGFEVENLEEDEENPVERERIEALLAQLTRRPSRARLGASTPLSSEGEGPVSR
jgi:hypothetical protein